MLFIGETGFISWSFICSFPIKLVCQHPPEPCIVPSPTKLTTGIHKCPLTYDPPLLILPEALPDLLGREVGILSSFAKNWTDWLAEEPQKPITQCRLGFSFVHCLNLCIQCLVLVKLHQPQTTSEKNKMVVRSLTLGLNPLALSISSSRVFPTLVS